METLKSIIGYEGNYTISNYGNVFSIKTNRFLKFGKSNSGYLQVCLSRNGFTKYHSIHRLVALHFIPNPDNKPQVNHKDNNKHNNNVTNLEWCTQSENTIHSFATTNRIKTSGMKGNFGKDHNRSKTIYEFTPKGLLLNVYESGLDFQRKTGKNHSSPSWSITHKRPIYGLYYSREPVFETST